mmetsp:Transcript_23577/g.59203  ORF Transcript_23577/g.59203 Transcript_23577/m.59203 type:complete len:284 (-) Transcript_23577:1055-1906(-)
MLARASIKVAAGMTSLSSFCSPGYLFSTSSHSSTSLALPSPSAGGSAPSPPSSSGGVGQIRSRNARRFSDSPATNSCPVSSSAGISSAAAGGLGWSSGTGGTQVMSVSSISDCRHPRYLARECTLQRMLLRHWRIWMDTGFACDLASSSSLSSPGFWCTIDPVPMPSHRASRRVSFWSSLSIAASLADCSCSCSSEHDRICFSAPSRIVMSVSTSLIAAWNSSSASLLLSTCLSSCSLECFTHTSPLSATSSSSSSSRCLNTSTSSGLYVPSLPLGPPSSSNT